MTIATPRYEPFTAAFTGSLSTWIDHAGTRWVFKAPLPRIEKGCAYMMKIHEGSVTMLPVRG
jgi:hypothetical protein